MLHREAQSFVDAIDVWAFFFLSDFGVNRSFSTSEEHNIIKSLNTCNFLVQ